MSSTKVFFKGNCIEVSNEEATAVTLEQLIAAFECQEHCFLYEKRSDELDDEDAVKLALRGLRPLATLQEETIPKVGINYELVPHSLHLELQADPTSDGGAADGDQRVLLALARLDRDISALGVSAGGAGPFSSCTSSGFQVIPAGEPLIVRLVAPGSYDPFATRSYGTGVEGLQAKWAAVSRHYRPSHAAYSLHAPPADVSRYRDFSKLWTADAPPQQDVAPA
jgi:hypothetical protein